MNQAEAEEFADRLIQDENYHFYRAVRLRGEAIRLGRESENLAARKVEVETVLAALGS